MSKGSVGVPTNVIIDTKKHDKEQKKRYEKKKSIKKNNAKVCLKCEENKEGWCQKYKGWCNKVNYQCNGYEMSFHEKKYMEFVAEQNKLAEKKRNKYRKKKKKQQQQKQKE